jgi:hypothetical protein
MGDTHCRDSRFSCRGSLLFLTRSVSFWDTLTSSQEVSLTAMCSLHGVHCFNKAISRREALNAELASLAQKCINHSGPPRGQGDRMGGITLHTGTASLSFFVPFLCQHRCCSRLGRIRHTPKQPPSNDRFMSDTLPPPFIIGS